MEIFNFNEHILRYIPIKVEIQELWNSKIGKAPTWKLSCILTAVKPIRRHFVNLQRIHYQAGKLPIIQCSSSILQGNTTHKKSMLLGSAFDYVNI